MQTCIYTQLGHGLKDNSESFIRSVVRHEMVHVRQYLNLRKLKKDLSTDMQDLNEYIFIDGGKQVAELEVEAYATEIT